MIRDFNYRPLRWSGLALAALVAHAGCDGDDREQAESSAGNAGTETATGETAGEGGAAGAAAQPLETNTFFALGSVSIDAEDNRLTYLQTIRSLDDGPFDNTRAIEMPGNGVLLARGADVFAGLAEEPTWVRYTAGAHGELAETGRLSFLDYGVMGIDYGNAVVSDDLAVSVLSGPAVAVVWNPTTMQVVREVDLGHLVVPGYSLEVWTTVAHEGLVYVPGRWANWDDGKVRTGVSTTIIDPVKGEIVGIAEDERCSSGGRIVFGKDGYGYVMGDGRTYSLQMFANAAGKPAPPNCLLRIAPGETDFEESFFYTIPSLTGGLDSITELDAGRQGGGYGFVKMFDPSRLPDDVKPVDFTFWSYPAHKMWRLELTDPPVAQEVEGLPYSAVGFDGSAFRGKLYTGESLDQGGTSDVYEMDPETNEGHLRFKMVGYFYGLYELSVAR
jgi:hypothetical protein